MGLCIAMLKDKWRLFIQVWDTFSWVSLCGLTAPTGHYNLLHCCVNSMSDEAVGFLWLWHILHRTMFSLTWHTNPGRQHFLPVAAQNQIAVLCYVISCIAGQFCSAISWTTTLAKWMRMVKNLIAKHTNCTWFSDGHKTIFNFNQGIIERVEKNLKDSSNLTIFLD